MNVLITYDISEDKRRTKIFNILKSYGQWVQLSVFECPNLTDTQYAKLRSRLSKLIDLNPEQFELLKNYITEHSNNIPQTRIEIKDYSVALHFREHPHLEHQVHAFALDCLAHFQDFELKAGKFVFELVPKGANKGSAIQQIIQQYHLNDHYPIFIGDDLTDEAGFQVINTFKGCSIKVGTGNTVAQHRLENVTQVQAFLAEFLEILKAQQQLLLEKLHVETHSVIKSCKST